MKAHIVATILLSSLLFGFVDTEFDSSINKEFNLEQKDMPCGKQTFSSDIVSAFKKESNLAQYSPSQIYLSKEWIVVLNIPYCNDPLSNFIDINKFDSLIDFEILSGTWVVEFQTGDQAFNYLTELYNKGYLWLFYPLVEKEVNLRFEPNDPKLSDQWYIDNSGQNNGTSGIDLNVQNVWNSYSGEGIVIGIVDDGIDHSHPDISPNFEESYSYDFCDSDTDVNPGDSSEWHGTAVAGIAAAKGNNSIGIAGISYNSGIAGIRLVSENCAYSYEEEYTLNDLAISQALIHEFQNIDIYTNSWGPEDDGKTLGHVGPLTIAAFEKGVTEGRAGLGSIYVWSNGNGLDNNDYSNKDGYANSRYTIAVGAINWQGKQTTYSEHGPNILVSAPSHNGSELLDAAVFTTDIVGSEGNSLENYTSIIEGTSATTPMVAGVIALMLEANPDLTWRDIQHILVRASQKVDSSHPGWFRTESNRDYNNAYGYGLVNANTAVALAEDWETVGSEVSVNTGKIIVSENINDNNDIGITSEYFVHQSINIETVEISVNLTHTDRGDLSVYLESPNGIVSKLVGANSQELNEHYRNWIFTSVAHWDENSFGQWKLKVNDSIDSTTGNFDDWNITFYGTSEPDSDGDGLPDYADSKLGTGYTNPDFDADGLLDGEEYYGWEDIKGNVHQTNPKLQDTDNDGLSDYDEGFDELFNPETNSFGVTNPNNNDTDSDGLFDGDERNLHLTSPLTSDTDGDTQYQNPSFPHQLTDYNEIFAFEVSGGNYTSSDPTKIDGDNDTMPDWYEVANGFGPLKKADGAEDYDLDGFDADNSGWPLDENEKLTNAQEYLIGTDPKNHDTDADGMPDGWEYHWGLDPLVSNPFEDFDNDTILNIYEYDNRQIENTIFSLTETSLKGYWKFDGTDSTSAFNLVNNDINSVLGNAEREPGKFLTGLKCDGVDDSVRMGSLDSSKFNEYTVQGWVKLGNYSSEFSTMVGTAQDGRALLGINEDNIFEFKVLSGGVWYITPITNDSIEPKLDVWYHLAATYSEINKELKLYVNGTLISGDTIENPSINTQSNYNYMCRSHIGDYLNGTIDHVAIWNRALSSDEISYVFNKPKGFGKSYTHFRPDDGNHFSNPNSTDTDGDKLSDQEEAYFGLDGFVTDITNADTDGDTISDYDEFMVYRTSPITNDTDGDNYTDYYDFKLDESTGLRINQTGDAFPLDLLDWNDTDGDGLGDNSDHYPLNSSEKYDTDGDSWGDNYENMIGTNPESADTDSDGTNDSLDLFPLDSSEYLDTDGDGVGDNTDACPEDKRDSVDTDGDSVCDKSDPFPENPKEWKDTDGDGYGDNSDAFPDDASRSVDYEEVKLEPQIEGGLLDSSMLVIVALGAVYFLFKKFSK